MRDRQLHLTDLTVEECCVISAALDHFGAKELAAEVRKQLRIRYMPSVDDMIKMGLVIDSND